MIDEKQTYLDVFISYRRTGGWPVAWLLYKELRSRNYNVFLDVDQMEQGRFDEQIRFNVTHSHCVLWIITGDSLNRCNQKDDWVLQEIDCAMKAGVAIIPILVDKPDVSGSYPQVIHDALREDGWPINVDNFKNIADSINKIIGYVEKAKPKFDEHNSYYEDEKQKVETDRLVLQENLTYKFEKNTYDRIISEYSQLDILDLGCSNGKKVMNRFANSGKVKRLVGFDFATTENGEKIVDVANKQYESFGFAHFYNANIETDEFYAKLDELTNNKQNKFNVIHISFLLLHLKDPEKLINKIYDYLEDGGTIYVEDVDDDLVLVHPDEGNKFKEAVEIANKYPKVFGNRKVGKEIYFYLKSAGYENIQLENTLLTPIELNKRQRQQIFIVWFSWIKERIDKLYNAFPQAKTYRKSKERMDAIYKDLEREFSADTFFYGAGVILFTAKK